MYDFKAIEKKWQDKWRESKIYAAHDDSPKPKYYQLETFPYPSAAGLHVGHPKGYIAEDIHARFTRMLGNEVMYTMGWDAFGLPTENYAIKVGKSPKTVAAENIANFKRQIGMFGLSYDWDREINTSSPEYYKWTQWLFIQLYKKGLAYRKKAKVNWCPKDQTVLANEQVINGRCERDGELVIQKDMEQWFFKITDYADRLLNDLEGLDWPEATIKRQKDWIGKSEGALIRFHFSNIEASVEVFTTRPDTLFGATYMVLAPENPLVRDIVTDAQRAAVEQYISDTAKKSELERTANAEKEKTGVFTGAYAINPATEQKIPVWIADYVLSTYGTGAVMAVPAHDERDFAFAKNFSLPVKKVVVPPQDEKDEELWTGEGTLINSGEYNFMPTGEARKHITADYGLVKTQYKLRDWSVSRQRYWGVPIPMVHCEKCGIQPIPDDQLPVMLPDDVDYRPQGMPPLASSQTFMETTCPNCEGPAKREPETLDTFVDSSWYFFRYTDPHNVQQFAAPEKIKQWMPVKLYVIGAEHTVLHLLYSRFIAKFLMDEGYHHFKEPFLKLHHVGLIQGTDGQKMSKSKGNVINPNDVIGEVGADAFRVYEMFMGPFEDGQPWDTNGVVGSQRLLEKVYRFQENFQPSEDNPNIHKLVKKVTADIPNFKFNTAIAAFMEFLNQNKSLSAENWKTFLKLFAPFAPHLTEELWEKLGNSSSIHLESWPKFDESKLVDAETTIPVQIMGKLRGTVKVKTGASEEDVKAAVTADPSISQHLAGKEVVKVIFIPNRLINYVIRQ
jgi:leucyl-tRNA synthetase